MAVPPHKKLVIKPKGLLPVGIEGIVGACCSNHVSVSGLIPVIFAIASLYSSFVVAFTAFHNKLHSAGCLNLLRKFHSRCLRQYLCTLGGKTDTTPSNRPF